MSEQPIIGLIAGNGRFPVRFAESARAKNYRIVAVCHQGETEQDIASYVDQCQWVKVGQLGKLIDTFRKANVKQVAMVGGINRVKLFGGVKLDLRGTLLLAKLRSTKDDVIMRGIAEELQREGIEVIPSTQFMNDYLIPEGVLTKSRPTKEEMNDISVGISALKAISAQDIGQLVVVQDGVVVAVEAVEGTDAAIERGGALGGAKTVVVKFAKTTQDLRFDMPTIGITTLQTMIQAKARVLALEAGKCLLLDKEEVIQLANKHGISIIGLNG